jgi:outer membrane lipoprotein-sorting protein
MNRIPLILFFLFPFLIQKSAAQVNISDAKAKLILSQTSSRYKLIKTLMANFSYTLYSPQDQVNQTQKGILWVKPGSNFYKIDFNDQELLSDGQNNYTHLKKEKEIQITHLDTSSQNINPAKVFTLYEKGYTYQFKESKIEKGVKLDIINLFPIAVKKIFKAEISIDDKTKLIYRIKTFDKNGDQLIYTINTYNLHPVISESFFKFDKKNFPGAEVVDLR